MRERSCAAPQVRDRRQPRARGMRRVQSACYDWRGGEALFLYAPRGSKDAAFVPVGASGITL